MKFAIISSNKDKASMNIKDGLLNNFSFKKIKENGEDTFVDSYEFTKFKNTEINLYTSNSELVFCENIDKKIIADIFIFISKHRAKDERNCFTAHPIGNFNEAILGGKKNKLCLCPSNLLKNIINELNINSKDSGYDVTLEATHHGPYINKPVLFAEVGSSEKNWEDKNAAKILAISLMNTINNNSVYDSAFVIGGSHYNYIANKLILKSNFSVGHICSKHNIQFLDEKLIKMTMKKSIPKSKFAIIDWKGLGKEKQRIINLLEKNNIKYERSDKFFNFRNI